MPSGVIFTNHLNRAKFNYQFTRDFSFPAFLDHNALPRNSALVSSAYSKRPDSTFLFTYLPHPGTAVYLGNANTFQNVDYNAAATPPYTLTTFPSTSADRQVFLKISYLLRF